MPQSRIIPILMETALGVRPHFTQFGDDYPTPDGTAVRDYVHVSDLVRAHTLALGSARAGVCDAFNVGTGVGFSVKQLIDRAREVTRRAIPVEVGPRRAGDPAELVAKADRVRTALGWSPEYTEPSGIIRTAWAWFCANPDGYAHKGG